MIRRPTQGRGLVDSRPMDTAWMEMLQRAFDGFFPSEQKFEEFLDRWERMP